MIDGCNRISALFRVVLPVAAPGIVAACIYAFGQVWNEYMFSFIFVNSASLKPLSVGLSLLIKENVVLWGKIMAGSIIAALPTLVLFLTLQKFFFKGMVGTYVKG